MKVILALAITQVAMAAIGVPEDTVPGKLRVSIVTTDGATVIATQDIDDSNQAGGSVEASFSGIPAGTYIGRAQRLTGDAAQSNLGSPYELSFAVSETVQTAPEPVAPKTYGQPVGLTATVLPD